MISFKQLITEFKRTSAPSTPSKYNLYDWGEKQVYHEAGTFNTPNLAFMKLDALYKKDPEAYGDLGVIKYEGNDVYSITRKNGKFFKSKI